MSETPTPNHQEELEEGFFSPIPPELRTRIRDAERARTEHMLALADASGISNVAMLENLVARGIGSEALAALTLYPLIAVAWADGRVDRGERQTALATAEECGLKPSSTSYRLLVEWLDHAPPDRLLRDAWLGVVRELCAEMGDAQRMQLETELLARTRAVASASGGFLGLGKISRVEQDLLDDLSAAFG